MVQPSCVYLHSSKLRSKEGLGFVSTLLGDHLGVEVAVSFGRWNFQSSGSSLLKQTSIFLSMKLTGCLLLRQDLNLSYLLGLYTFFSGLCINYCHFHSVLFLFHLKPYQVQNCLFV